MNYHVALVLLTFLPTSTFAEETKETENRRTAVKQILKIEDFLPERRNWTLSTGMSVSQISNQSLSSSVYQYEISPNITVPFIYNVYSDNKSSSVSGFLSAQYGATKNISPFISISGSYNEVLSVKNGESEKATSDDLSNYTLGVSYQFNTIQPFNIISLSYSNSEYSKTPSVGLLSNWIFDPVVISLSTRYQHSTYKSGRDIDNFSVGGSLSFAVNPEITIQGGINNNFNFSSDQSFLKESQVNLGVAMNLTESITMSTGTKFSVSGNDKFSYDVRFTFKV